MTTPLSIGRGMCDSELELRLQPGEDTAQKKQCNTLAGRDMTEYHLMPMIECLEKNVQDKKRIIEEENGWVKKWYSIKTSYS